MKQYRMAHAATMALACLVATSGATAAPPDPDQIAEACIERVTARAAQRVERNEALASECVATIEQLLEAGEVEAAHRAAARCIRRIRAGSQHAIGHVRRDYRRCVHRLLHLGAPELAQAVRAAGREAVETIKDSRREAVTAIRDALPDGQQ